MKSSKVLWKTIVRMVMSSAISSSERLISVAKVLLKSKVM
jgi:hypothetical protein